MRRKGKIRKAVRRSECGVRKIGKKKEGRRKRKGKGKSSAEFRVKGIVEKSRRWAMETKPGLLCLGWCGERSSIVNGLSSGCRGLWSVVRRFFQGQKVTRSGASISGIFFVICLLMFAGCKTRRDLLFDPANTPIIVPTDFTYRDLEGTVVVGWRYLGVQPPVRFRFIRVERDGFHILDWEDLPAPSRPIDERADVWEMAPVVDAVLNSGEEYAYILRTETDLKLSAEEPLGSIQIPGARIEDVILHPERGTATVQWHVEEGEPLRYELFRQVDGESPQMVFQTDHFADSSFADVLPEGNREYVYMLRNFINQDVVLDSRSFSLFPYPRSSGFDLSEPVNVHLDLTPADALASDILALQATGDAVAVRNIGRLGYIIGPRILPMPNREQLKLASLSIGVTPVGNPQVSHVLLAGILSDAVQLSAFVSTGSAFVEVPWQYTSWHVDDPDVSTAMAVAPDGKVFVGVGQQMRVFIFEGDGVVELGQFDLDVSDDVQSLAAYDSGIWVVTTDGQVFRSSSVNTVQNGLSPVWEQVVLPVDAYPIGVSGYQQAVYVLDGAQKRVLAFDFDGQPGLWWRGLDDLDLSAGGLAVSQGGDVYVWDAQNRMVQFRNAPAALERFVNSTD